MAWDGDPRDPGTITGYRVVPRGGQQLTVIVEGAAESVFEEISKIDPSDDEQVTELCNQYGLWLPPSKPKSKDPDDNWIWSRHFQQRHSDLMELLKLAAVEDWPSLERVAARMLNPSNGGSAGSTIFDCRRMPGSSNPRLITVTHDLFRFAALQICAAISDGQKIKQCPNCAGYFAAGPNTGRKLDGTFCSARCRVAAHRAKE